MTTLANASWIPGAALVVGLFMALMILRIVGAVFSQALEHHNLAISARRLRSNQLARMREMDEAIKRETKSRAAQAKHTALLAATPEQVVGVDIVPELIAA